jgi:hypothetical protein
MWVPTSSPRVETFVLANGLAIAGIVLLAVAITAVTYVVTDEMHRSSLPRIVAAGLAARFAVVWFVVPRFFRRESTPPHLDPADQPPRRRA